MDSAIANLRLFVGVIFFLMGLLIGAFVSLLIVRKAAIAVGIGIVLAGASWLIRSQWHDWKDLLDPYLLLGSFMSGFGISMIIFFVTREAI